MSDIPHQLKIFSETFVQHFESTLITHCIVLRNVSAIPGGPNSFAVGHALVSKPSYSLQDAGQRLCRLADQFYQLKKAPKPAVPFTEFSCAWLADVQRYSSDSMPRKALVQAACELFQSFATHDIDEDMIKLFAKNAAEMVVKFYASPIYGKNVTFDSKTILNGILLCCSTNVNNLKSLDEQSLLETCFGKLFPTIFKIEIDKNKSAFGKLFSESGILHDGQIYEKTNTPKSITIRRLLPTIETNNKETILSPYNLKTPYDNSYSFVLSSDSIDENIVETLMGQISMQKNAEDVIEAINSTIMEDVKKITLGYKVNVIEDLIGSLNQIEANVNCIEEEDEEDEKKTGNGGGGSKVTNIKHNKMGVWKATFN